MQAAKREVDAHMAGHHFFFQVVVLESKRFQLKSSGQRQKGKSWAALRRRVQVQLADEQQGALEHTLVGCPQLQEALQGLVAVSGTQK